MSDAKSFENVSVEENDRSEITITADIPSEQALSYRKRAMKHLGRDIEVPGFRKGHVPEKMLLDRLGDHKLWEEIAEMAIADAYPHIISEQKLRIIGRPRISVTKLAPGNPISFKIEAALEPKITLPDYKAIAREVMKEPDEITVSDKDVHDVIKNLRTNKWRIDNKEKAEKGVEPNEEELPELTDELVKTLGDFKNVEDFNAKLLENLKIEKERKAREKKRIALGEQIIAGASISLPRVLVEGELDGMLGQFRTDIERMGMQYDEYLKQVGKTETELRKEWEADAKKRAKLQLVLNEIAKKENVTPDEKAVEHEITHLKEHFKDADERRLRLYVMTVLQNEAVFQFLEKQHGDTSN